MAVWNRISAVKKMAFLKALVTLASTAILATVLLGCNKGSTAPEQIAESSPTQSTPEPTPKTAFERDMQYVRNSQFTHVWVFARKDGKVLDKDDAAYLRTNAPQVVDWVTTDEGKKVIAGTNFDLELGGMNLLRKRFVVENYTGK